MITLSISRSGYLVLNYAHTLNLLRVKGEIFGDL